MQPKSILFTLCWFLILELSCIFAGVSDRNVEKSKKKKHKYKSSYCTSWQCQRAGEYLSRSINYTINPCDDFYKFACGNWEKNHPYTEETPFMNVDEMVDRHNKLRVANYLSAKSSKKEPKAVKKAKQLFKQCRDTRNIDENNKFQQIGEILSELELPVVPSFTNTSPGFQWAKTSILSLKLMRQNFFFGFTTSNPMGDSKLVVTMPKPYFGDSTLIDDLIELPYENLLDESNSTEEHLQTNELYKYIKYVVKFAYNETELKWSDEKETQFNNLIKKFFSFNLKFKQLKDDHEEIEFKQKETLSIGFLQKFTDLISECKNASSMIDWEAYFDLIFEDTDIILDFDYADVDIDIQNSDYLMELFKLLSITPPEVLEFYMWWKTVYAIIPFTNSILNKQYDKFYHNMSDTARKPRDVYCAELTQTELPLVIYYLLTTNKTVKEDIAQVEDMVDEIREAFSRGITRYIDWMDDESRERARKKLDAMGKRIGYLKWMSDPKKIDAHYENITSDEDYDEFIGSLLSLRRAKFYLELKNFREPFEFSDDFEMWDPLLVNAFYEPDANRINIPAAQIFFPFYELGLESLNYGSIGTILGHEIVHGFDTSGKDLDQEGNENPLITEKSKTEYEQRSKCFADFYTDLTIPGMKNSENDLWLNGNQTIDENIADNGGLRIAFYAYQRYVKRKGEEKLLQPLKQYSNDQLFFISFANAWCGHGSKELLQEAISYDVHSPGFVRVLASVMNSKEFAETWQCPEGSPMNPKKDKCKMW